MSFPFRQLPLALFLFLFPQSRALSADSWKVVRTLASATGSGPSSGIKAGTGPSVQYSLNQCVGDSGENIPENGGYYVFRPGYLSQVLPFSLVFKILEIFSSGSGQDQFDGYGDIVLQPGSLLKIRFSQPVNLSEYRDNIRAEKIADNFGSFFSIPLAVDLSSSAASYAALGLSSSWSGGGVYSVAVSTGMRSKSGINLSDGARLYFSVYSDTSQLNVALLWRDAGSSRAQIDPGSLMEPFFIKMSTVPDSAAEEASRKISASPLKVLNVSVLNSQGNPAVLSPGFSGMISFSYLDNNNDGFVDGTSPPVKAESLCVWQLDRILNAWMASMNSVFDPFTKTIRLKVGHFSTFALIPLASLDIANAYAYPVPYKPGAGDAARYGRREDGIRFMAPLSGTIKIFTITGRLVREIDIASNLSPSGVKWDTKTADGNNAGSGIYLWKIDSGGKTKTGKLVIVR